MVQIRQLRRGKERGPTEVVSPNRLGTYSKVDTMGVRYKSVNLRAHPGVAALDAFHESHELVGRVVSGLGGGFLLDVYRHLVHGVLPPPRRLTNPRLSSC